MQSFVQFITITRMTALEASRQPIFLLLTTAVVLFTGLLPLLVTHVLSDSARMVRDSALALQFVSGLVLACYAATSTITRELRKGTLASIISKPIPRSLFFLAKFSGVAFIMFCYALATTLATMLAVRTAAIPYHYDAWGILPLFIALGSAYFISAIQNYCTRTPFVSRAFTVLVSALLVAFTVSALRPAPYDGGFALPLNILPAGFLLGLAMILLSAFAVSFATRLEMVPVFSLCLGLFLLGLLSDFFFGARAATSPVFAALYAITPNWQHFWVVDALHGGHIPWTYTAQALIYVIAYSTAVLSLGLWTFKRMEVK